MNKENTSEDLFKIADFVNLANSDEPTKTVIEKFAGDIFCIETEIQKVFMNVLKDGSLVVIEDKPSKFTNIKTSENFLSKAWEKICNNEQLTAREINKNLKIPLKFKMKLVYKGLIKKS